MDRRGAIAGGTSCSIARAISVPPEPWTRSIRSSSSTPPAPPASPRALCHIHRRISGRTPLRRRSWVFDLKDDDIYWCTADIGWVTGHSYVVYGPLANGATAVMYEGAPNFPEPDRFWRIIEKYRVTILYTAPTAIRAFMRMGRVSGRNKHDLSQPAPARHRRRADQSRSVDVVPRGDRQRAAARSSIPGGRPRPATIMISPLPGATPTKPGIGDAAVASASMPTIVDRARRAGARRNRAAYLIVDKPWPSMLRTICGDHERYLQTSTGQRIPGMLFHRRRRARDEDGYFWIMGRVDDVINVAGHRLGHDGDRERAGLPRLVAEAAVVGRPDEMKGRRRRLCDARARASRRRTR